MTEDKLLPCPWCGKKPRIVYDKPWFYISCKNDDCIIDAAYTDDYDTVKEAIKAWNTRTNEAL